MEILDFLPKYPNIENSNNYGVLNPYSTDFYESIFRKKEFYDLKLTGEETFPKQKGILTKYQNTISRYMSSYTPYENILLVHSMGLGKCVLPETIIRIDNIKIKISDIWNLYSDKIILDELGQWSKPKVELNVYSYNEKTGIIEQKRIVNLYRQYIREYITDVISEDGYSLSMTKKHKIYTEKGWQNNLNKNIKIAVKNTDNIYFTECIVKDRFYEGWVYDLEVEETHTYFANDILTHNTCSAIGAVEQIRNEENNFIGALVLAKGKGILDNFLNELVNKCTYGQYIPSDYKNLTSLERIQRIKKLTSFYQLKTFAKFSKKIKQMSNIDIIDSYSNKVIIIDEVHNIRPQEDKKDTFETYEQIHRMLHLVKNCKVLLLSGTPMKDAPEEIATVMNLILPSSEQFPSGQDFISEYMFEEQKGIYKLKPEMVDIFKNKIKGKISFLKEPESTIPKKFIGTKNYKNLKHFIVAPNTMSDFQTENYKRALDFDKSGKKGVYTNSREATLFTFPDGSYGNEGFNKYIKSSKIETIKKGKKKNVISSYKLSDELINELKGRNDNETLNNIKKYSSIYAQVIEQIIKTSGNCFIYSSIVQGSGAILFSLLLELFGFFKSRGKETTKGLRYAILTTKTASSKELRDITDRFNNEDNIFGDYIKVIIGSRAVSEGYSFRNVIFEAILTPHWNYSEISQALARGIRLGSHNDLLKKGLNPNVYIMQPVSIPLDDKITSIDLYLYKISEDKDIAIRSILRILMENAFDCALNYIQNSVKGKDGTRECDYTVCKYKCDGIDIALLTEDDIDYTTYQLYYSNPKTPLIRRKIEQIFRNTHKTDYQSIFNILKKKFTEEEIDNALVLLREESKNDEFDYKMFVDNYMKTPVEKIIIKLEELFRNKFKLDFNFIKQNLENYTDFEILIALNNIITNNLVLTDKYGFSCYLRESKNIYFLVNNLSVKPDVYTEYYTQKPHISVKRNFSEILNRIYILSLPKIVEKISKCKTEKEFITLLKTIPIDIQEFFIESSLLAQKQNINTNIILRNRILEYFKSYIKDINGVFVINFSKLRCLHDEKWEDCDEKYKDLLSGLEEKRLETLRENNPYGIIGKFNPETKSFCIVDFKKEKQAKKKTAKNKEDRRINYSGKVCRAGGWKIQELINIMVHRLKINPPKHFRKNETETSLLSQIKKDEDLSFFLSKNPDKNELLRILYWGLGKNKGGKKGIEPICFELKEWLEEKGLLEIDNLCGVQGKKKEKKEEKTNIELRLEKIVPINNQEKFKNYTKNISKLLDECFNTKNSKITIDDSLWIIVFLRKKIVGFLTIDTDNTLWNVCIDKKYRQKGIAKQAIKTAIDHICSIKGKTPSLSVDNRTENVKKLISMYESFGFNISKSDNRYTYMEYSCNQK